jgi:hypothetical protein
LGGLSHPFFQAGLLAVIRHLEPFCGSYGKCFEPIPTTALATSRLLHQRYAPGSGRRIAQDKNDITITIQLGATAAPQPYLGFLKGCQLLSAGSATPRSLLNADL